MTLDPELLQQLIETFTLELEEQLQVVTNGLLQLEKSSAHISEQPTTIEMIFRASHNIKGTANSLGINNVGEIAHHVETLFSSIQKNTLAFSHNLVDLVFEAVDKMRIAMNCFLEKKELPFDLKELLTRLDNGGNGVGKPLAKKTKKIITKTSKKSPKNRVLSSSVSEPLPRESNTHEMIRVTIENLDHITALTEAMQVNKIAIDQHYLELTTLITKSNQHLQIWNKIKNILKNTKLEKNDELQKLKNNGDDSLMEVIHALSHLHKNMRLRINELTILSHSLQEEMRMLRLIPASKLLQTLPRVVRDLAKQTNKKVDLIIQDDNAKIDKMILEQLKDSILHLLRNAIDHGIESASVRKKHNKPNIGCITIEVKEKGNQVLIRITDDGAGIDVKKIAKISEKKKLVTSEELQKMSEADIINLIFRPGFSTREIITNISGRGIGLNVVKEKINQLKGKITVSSKLGQFTKFDLYVPLTLTSERGLIVTCGAQLFVIPTTAVEHALTLNINDIVHVGGTQAVILDGHSIPLFSLAGVLNLEKQEPITLEQLTIVLIKSNDKLIALLVDAILGEREIVVKPLQRPINNLPGITGGTLSGDGQVMIVINAGDIIDIALHTKPKQIIIKDEKSHAAIRPHILVADDSITTRTLEKSILESKGYQVTVAVNGKEAWDALQKQKFALLISDVVMPFMDGFTLTDRVKKTAKLQDMPVIIVTSLGSDAEKKRGIDVGADAYIVKSEFESGVLLEIVAQLV